jgi:desumoylating isopeptidase 1
MAKVFSPMFLGKEIQGIWHTGIIVYGIEYYFGGGIC